MTTLIVNYTELRFTSEVEMTRYLSQTEEIWNEKVMAMLLESGLQRKTVTQNLEPERPGQARHCMGI